MREKPIYHEDSEKLERLYSKLIGRHNLLCAIEETFEKNKTLSRYFEEAKREVLDSGNQSISSMYVIALEAMAQELKDNEETPKEDELLSKIYKLESENRILKGKLNEIQKIL